MSLANEFKGTELFWTLYESAERKMEHEMRKEEEDVVMEGTG